MHFFCSVILFAAMEFVGCLRKNENNYCKLQKKKIVCLSARYQCNNFCTHVLNDKICCISNSYCHGFCWIWLVLAVQKYKSELKTMVGFNFDLQFSLWEHSLVEIFVLIVFHAFHVHLNKILIIPKIYFDSCFYFWIWNMKNTYFGLKLLLIITFFFSCW